MVLATFKEAIVSTPRKGLALGAVGLVAGLGLLAVARIEDVKRWFISQWDTPHGITGWLFGAYMVAGTDELYRPAADYAKLTTDDELLDVACGGGGFLGKYARDVGWIAGIDRSDIQLKIARRLLGKRLEEGTAELLRGDAAALPWENDTFSVVTCILGLEFFSNPGGALVEMHRVLRPGGRLVATFWINEDDEECVRECDWFGLDHLPEDEVRKIVEDAGFAAIEVTYPSGLNYHARFIQAIKPE